MLGQLRKVTSSYELSIKAHHFFELSESYRTYNDFVHLHNQVAGGWGGKLLYKGRCKWDFISYLYNYMYAFVMFAQRLSKIDIQHHITQQETTPLLQSHELTKVLSSFELIDCICYVSHD